MGIGLAQADEKKSVENPKVLLFLATGKPTVPPVGNTVVDQFPVRPFYGQVASAINAPATSEEEPQGAGIASGSATMRPELSAKARTSPRTPFSVNVPLAQADARRAGRICGMDRQHGLPGCERIKGGVRLGTRRAAVRSHCGAEAPETAVVCD